MKLVTTTALFLISVFTGPACTAQSKLTVSQSLDVWISTAETEIVSAAEAMPEDRYRFAPTQGEFTGARTFADQVKHLAANNYRVAAFLLGQTPTADENAETGPEQAQSKAQIVGYLRGSFAALHLAVEKVTADNATEPTASSFNRIQLAVDAVAHSYDHYGQMVEYLRMNGIVPPASRK
jgi:hypothetical protein